MKTVEKYNNKLAQIYDKATALRAWTSPRTVKRLLLDYKIIKKNLSVLDLGVGTGQTIEPFVNKNCKIFGIDISNEMLRIVKKKYSKIKTFKADINQGLKQLAFKNQSFDIIIASGILEFIENLKKIIKEVHNLLKEDGYFIFSYEMLLDKNFYQKIKTQYISEKYIKNPSRLEKFKLYRRSKKEVNQLLQDSGYKLIKHFKFKAYTKGLAKIPVYYAIVVARK